MATLGMAAAIAGCSATGSSAPASGPTTGPTTAVGTPGPTTASTMAASPSGPRVAPSSGSTLRIDHALLPVAQLPRPAGFGPWSRRTEGQGPALIGAASCALSASALADVAHKRRDYVGPAGQAAAEVVAAFADVGAAEQAWQSLQEQTRGCSTGTPEIAHLPGIGDRTALLVTESREPSPAAPDALAVGLVRTGRVVSLLVVQVPARTAPAVATVDPMVKAVAAHSAPFGQ